MHQRYVPRSLTRLLTYISLAMISLYCAALPMIKFSGRGYRDDEAWAIYRSMNSLSRIVELVMMDVKPPIYYFILTGWIRLFGHTEPMTGYLSSLMLLLTLAFTYQMGRLLFGRLAGLWAALMLGLLPLIMHYAHETNTYSLLLLGTTGTSAAFISWLKTRKGHYAVLYVALGILLVFNHYYGVYVILAQAGFALIFITLKARMLLRAFSLFVAIGMAFVLAWGLVLMHTMLGYRVGGGFQFYEGTFYGLLEHIYIQFQSRPTGILVLTFLFGITTAYAATHIATLDHVRWGQRWRKGFPLTVIILISAIVLLLNARSPSVTDRNLIVLLPFVCAISGFGLVHTPLRMQAIVLMLVGVAGYTTYWESDNRRTYIEIPRFMAADYRIGDAIFLDFYARADQIAATYYTRERQYNTGRVPAEDIYHVLRQSEYERLAPIYPQTLGHVAPNAAPETLDAIREFLAGRERAWHFQVQSQSYSSRIPEVISEEFAVGYTQILLPDIYATLWRRMPDTDPDYYFDEAISLDHWHLISGFEAPACTYLWLETWWRAEAELDENYSLGVKLVSREGNLLANEDDQLSHVLTGQWREGSAYVDTSRLAIPCDAPAGQYDLIVIVYDSRTPEFPLEVTLPGSDAPVGTLAYLTSVQVTPRE